MRIVSSFLLVATLSAAIETRGQCQEPGSSSRAPTPAVFPTADSVLRRMWRLAVDSSQLEQLAQPLLDSIGPRLDGSPSLTAARTWVGDRYRNWGVPTHVDAYGTQRAWQRVNTHVDLVEPRHRTLEGTMLAFSPGLRRPVDAEAVLLPEVADSGEFARWATSARGKYVLISNAESSCRPPEEWSANAMPSQLATFRRQRAADSAAWLRRIAHTGYSTGLATGPLGRRLEEAGVAGVVTSRWAGGWGVDQILSTDNKRAPAIDLSCEDYGLVFRLADHNQHPVLHVEAVAMDLGETQTANVIAELRGTVHPDEYVVLSAHLDSWDGASGATDNGTGTLVMMEAMRILHAVLPHPSRTILAGHWGGEEMGLVGSRSFTETHPEVLSGLQVAFNQDNGTGRVQILNSGGLLDVAPALARWTAQLPAEVAQHLTTFLIPGFPLDGSSDQTPFICAGAPGLRLRSRDWDYYTYTWHTNRDTYDKLVFDDLKNNAVLVASLAYLASEDTARVGRAQRLLVGADGKPALWPACAPPHRVDPRP